MRRSSTGVDKNRTHAASGVKHWVSMKNVVIFTFCWAFSPAFSQITTSMPTEVDLKAAYCIPVFKNHIASFSGLAAAGNPPAVIVAATKGLSQFESDLRRIRLYLVPRLEYLDSTALLAASKSGEEDIARSRAEPRGACFTQCKTVECAVACPESAETARLRSCAGARFLPF